jgi:Uma2 family endonuclease
MQINLEPPYLIVKPGISEEEFYRVADEDSDWEYLDGRILMHSPASDQHENLFHFLLTLLSAYLDEKRGAVVRRLVKITWSIISIEVKLYSSIHHEICVS